MQPELEATHRHKRTNKVKLRWAAAMMHRPHPRHPDRATQMSLHPQLPPLRRLAFHPLPCAYGSSAAHPPKCLQSR
eukprot:338118-Pleurochrysis_carterae.AAC.1